MSSHSKGFTIVELLIATVIFSLVLIGAMAGLVQISRLYYRGITFARTQNTARNVVNEIGQSIQFSRKTILIPPASSGDISYFCVGPIRYSYAINRKLSLSTPVAGTTDIRHVLWVDEPTAGCANATPVPGPADLTKSNPCGAPANCSNGRELLSENMRISKFNIIDNKNHTYTTNLYLAYGDDDLLTTVNGRQVCKSSGFTAQFCAISELSTTVLRRVQ